MVGCGNSGGQIAEDLALGGREVFLATGRNGRIPRRYRGRDIILWNKQTGRYEQPRTNQCGRPLLGSTHTISLQSLGALGSSCSAGSPAPRTARSCFADDLAANAAHADHVSAEMRREIDDFIARNDLAVEPPAVDEADALPARFPNPPIRSLDLLARGVSTIIWCVGYTGDFSWLRVPGATDGATGQPAQSRCLSVPGVYFVGLELDGIAAVRHHHGRRRRIAPRHGPPRGSPGGARLPLDPLRVQRRSVLAEPAARIDPEDVQLVVK